MPRALRALAPLFVLITACAPKVDIAAETAALRARSEGVIAAEMSQNVDAAVAFYAQDAIVLPAGAPLLSGRDAVRQMYAEVFGSGAVKAFESIPTVLEVAASGDIGYEYGVNRFTLNTPGGEMLDVGKYVAVWKKIDGEWYAAVLSFSSDAPAPTPVAPATPAK
jgi:ketosteroid isomerase-like protein